MSDIVFDSSTIISLATNDLLWTLPVFRKKIEGKFYITKSVKSELVDKPIHSKQWKLEAFMILNLLTKKVIDYYEDNLNDQTNKLLFLANNIFKARDNYITLVHLGEIEALALAIKLNAVYAVDERTTRMLIENPKNLHKLLESKLHTEIQVDNKNLKDFQKEAKNIKIIRSADLMTVAFENGLLDEYTAETPLYKDGLKNNLLDGLLWGLKLRGCSISRKEIDEIMKIEGY